MKSQTYHPHGNIAAAFSRHAQTYDSFAFVQRTVAGELDEHLAAFIPQHSAQIRSCIDLGCGTGALSMRLVRRYTQARIQLCDISSEMLAIAERRLQQQFLPMQQKRLKYTLGDAEYLSISSKVDINASNFCAQWFADPLAALQFHYRQSKYLGWSLLLDGSFARWIAAHSTQPAGIRKFITLGQLEATVTALSPKRYHILQSTHTIPFPTARAFLREIRAIGAMTAREGYTPLHLRPILRRFENGFEAEYRIACILLEQ